MVSNTNGIERIVDISYNKFHNTTVAYSSDGYGYALATNTDRVYDWSASCVFYTYRTKDISSDLNNPYREYTYNRIGKYHLEKVFNDETKVYDINRVQRPKMIIQGERTDAKVAITYYDSNNTINPVKFRYGVAKGSNVDGGLIGVSSTYSGADTSENNDPSLIGGSGKNFHIVASKNTKFRSGDYSAVGMTPKGYAVVAWYDASVRRLCYSYNENPSSAVVGGVWQTNAIYLDEAYTGWYVDMAVDSDGGIHIAYYNSAKGDLKYAYLSSYNDTNPTVVTVDSYLSVGTNITINVRKEGDKQIPYIYYYNASATQTPNSIKVAWQNDVTTLRNGAVSDKFTGAWEAMTIPTQNIPSDATVCGGIPTTGTYGNKVILGYMSDTGYEKAVLKK